MLVIPKENTHLLSLGAIYKFVEAKVFKPARAHLSHCLVMAFVFAFCAQAEATQETPGFRGKIRGGFLGRWDIALVPKMKESGLNLAMPLFQQVSAPVKLYQIKRIKEWTRICQESGLKFMPVINFWGKYESDWIRPHHYVYYNYNDLQYGQTPCPLDIGVYKQSVHNRLLELARLSRKLKIAGCIVDLEMYGADRKAFPDLCLCDNCFERFLAGRRVPKPILVHERYKHLKRTNQFDAYKVFMEEHIASLARRTREQVELIAPDFLIGVFRLDENRTYNRGLAKGFGSGDKPVLAFTARTYRKGYQPYIQETIQRFRDEHINANLVVGIWQDKFPVENLPEQYYHCARSSSGYWIYTLQSLHERKKNPLPFPRSQYWQAIRKANAELDLLAINPNYQSALRIRPFRMPRHRFDTEKLALLRRVRPLVDSDLKAKPLTFRESNTLVFVAQKGDRLKFELKFGKYRVYEGDYAQLALLTYNGTVLASDDATVGRNGVLTATAPYTGAYGITLDSERQRVVVVSYSHPYSIDAARSMHLMSPNQPLYLWKPAKCTLAQVVLRADHLNESYTATFRDESGRVLGRYDVFAKEKVQIQLRPSLRGQIIELRVKARPRARLSDVRIKVESGFGKYISPTKSGLVRIVESPSRIKRK